MAIKLIKKISIFLMLMLIVLSSCKTDSISSEEDKRQYDFIFSDENVSKRLFELFDINSSSSPKVFKILMSRHENFVRVTISQILSNLETKQLPAGAFEYKKNLFLYYNGSEILFERHLSSDELDDLLLKSNVLLNDSLSSWKNSKVLQFDKDFLGQIIINSPAISPCDEQINSVKFK